ncbi:MAG TPA: energy-coupling factor transporter ATPase [Nitrospiria bacterium]|nr:energy-coupling factor transporter ATPase [Nitrospiria bacterium]
MSFLSIRDLSFRYKNAPSFALSQISTSIAQGERVGVAGPSGAGKSTLLLTFNGLIPHLIRGEFQGEVLVKGRKTSEGRVGSFAEAVGLVFQEFEYQLFASTVELEVAFGPEGLGLPRDEIGRRIDWALERTGLLHLRHRTIRTLSGGEKQRLAIAAVLAMRPQLLCLDEATTDLDPAGKASLLSMAETGGWPGSSMLVVEHDADALLEMNRLFLMDRGKIAADGPSDQLLRDTQLLRSLRLRPPQTVALFEALSLPERPVHLREADRLLEERYPFPVFHSVVTLDSPPVGSPIIEVAGVSSRYGKHSVLRGVDLSVRKGECLAIVGPNGSGKSTLLKHLNGLLMPEVGEIRIDGIPTRQLGLDQISQRVGYVFQNPDHQIFANTLFEEAAFGLRIRKRPAQEVRSRVEEALSCVGLLEKKDADPFTLTRGERQRLAVASVLVTAPEVILLDEPTTGLDPGEIEEMTSLIQRLRREGCTFVIVTHAIHLVAEQADRLIVLKEGRIIFDGPTREGLFNPTLLEQGQLRPTPIIELSRRRATNALSIAEFVSSVNRTISKEVPRVP